MKRVTLYRHLSQLMLCALVFSAIGCVGMDEPKKKKPVPPPSDDISGLSWNRPRSFESNAGLGRMMPQSR